MFLVLHVCVVALWWVAAAVEHLIEFRNYHAINRLTVTSRPPEYQTKVEIIRIQNWNQYDFIKN